MHLIIFLILGLAVGSFLNVLVYRLRTAEELIFDHSKCPHCKNPIRWYDNIPLVSFMLLQAQCRDCKKAISWQYPLVEFFTGALFTLVGYKFFVQGDISSWLLTAYYLGAVSFLIVIFVYDFLYLEIPGAVLWTGTFWAIAFNLYFDWSNWMMLGDQGSLFDSAIYSGVLAAMIGFSFFFLLVAVSREKWMGMGDAYLAILLGLVIGWPKIFLALFLAFAIGAIFGTILILEKKKTMKSQLPFAPYLVAGTIISMFFYSQIAGWYWGLFYF